MTNYIALSETQVIENPFLNERGEAPFYRMLVAVACKPIGKTYDDVATLDCTRILVSPNIQDNWISAMKEAGLPEESIMMTLANWGPKASKDLATNTVVLQEGALEFTDGTMFPADTEQKEA